MNQIIEYKVEQIPIGDTLEETLNCLQMLGWVYIEHLGDGWFLFERVRETVCGYVKRKE